jgi:membrane protein YqaA with SNARE-associated domain
MRSRYLLFIVAFLSASLFIGTSLLAQQKPDSTSIIDTTSMIPFADSTITDSIQRAADSLLILQKRKSIRDNASYKKLMTHPYLPMQTKPSFRINELRIAPNFDGRFYLIIGMLFYLAFIKVTFPKYFSNVFQLIFQSPIRQKQTREQLQQNNLASLFSNILFILNASIFVSLIAIKNGWVDLTLYSCIAYSVVGFTALYLFKFLFLWLSGWLFSQREAIGNYSFIVFLTNKVMGVFLIPAILLLAFSPLTVQDFAYNSALIIISILFVYRYLISFSMVRASLKVSAFHFFLYLCTCEVLPMLVLYKLTMDFISGTF